MKIRIKKILCLIIVCIQSILLFGCVKLDLQYKSTRLLNNLYVANEDMYANAVAYNIVVPDIIENQIVSDIGAESYFIGSLDKDNAPYTKYKNPYQKLEMASLTKLMTMLVVLENCSDFNEKYYVSMNAVDLDKNDSVANLRAGDMVSVIDLLYGLIIPSGNDAANCLAENLNGGIDNFLLLMNNEAERLGALNTHFANPHGLDAEYHFSTAYDLFLITRELAKYDIFREISVCKEYTANIEQSNGSIRTEKWENTNYFVTDELPISNQVSLLGGKTGTTTGAGNCLILLTKAKNTDIEYISVVLNAKSKRNSYYNSNALINGIK